MSEPVDNWLETRKAVVAHLTAAEPIAGLVPANKIWGEAPKSGIGWPFIRVGFAVTTAFEAQGWGGATHRMSIHSFAKGEDTGDVQKIAKAVVARMQTLAAPDGLSIVDLQWVGNSTVRDSEEANAFHVISDFDITVA